MNESTEQVTSNVSTDRKEVVRKEGGLRGICLFYYFLGAAGILSLISSPAIFVSKGSKRADLIFLLVVSVVLGLHFFLARGLKALRKWAYHVANGEAIFLLFGFPIGTVIGILILVYLHPRKEVFT